MVGKIFPFAAIIPELQNVISRSSLLASLYSTILSILCPQVTRRPYLLDMSLVWNPRTAIAFSPLCIFLHRASRVDCSISGTSP